MNCSIQRNSLLSLRVLVAALMGSLVLVCFAQPATPNVNVEIIVIDGADYVKLSWEEVEDAASYNIYSSTNPYLEDWGEPLVSVGDSVFTYTTEDSVDELGRRYFFYVTAYTEVDIPDWLVLVNGRQQFNGDVTIDPFYLGKYEVTQSEWTAVMGGIYNPAWTAHYGIGDNYPAYWVSWLDAVEYCNRSSIREGLTPCYSYDGFGNTNPDNWPAHADRDPLLITCDWNAERSNGYRLPTEAEWNHAANAGIHPPLFTYSGSNDINEVAWYSGNSGGTAHPVGVLAPNGLGIYDMSGNVWEWCWDRWGGRFPSGDDNPRGDGLDATLCLRRGGSWGYAAANCDVSSRRSYNAAFRYANIGFRVSRVIP